MTPQLPWLPDGFSFLSGYPTTARKRRVLMPFQAIADDSGCDGSGPLIVMGGLIGRAEWWAEFADHWDACLHEKPTIPYFKFYDATRRRNGFRGFSEDARNKKLIDLVRVLDMHPFAALHMTMSIDEHKRSLEASHPAPERRRKKRFRSEGTERSSYFYVYSAFVNASCVHLWRQGEREQFEFIVDEHPSLGKDARDWFPVIRAGMVEPYRSIMPLQPITKDDQKFLPLQAADLVAGVQRTANAGAATFNWLNSHFKQVRMSPLCLYMGRDYFDRIIAAMAERKRNGSLEIDILTELVKLGNWGPSDVLVSLDSGTSAASAESPPPSEQR